eukprot:205948_1
MLTNSTRACNSRTIRLLYFPLSGYHRYNDRVAMSIKHDERIETLKRMDLPHRFFVYGTLRDDDDSGAEWTRNWINDVSFACNAKVYGFKMYKLKGTNYPFALRTNDDNDVIIGRLLQWTDEQTFYEKVLGADDIEDYDDTHPDDDENEYIRDIVDVHMTDNAQNEITKAIIYYQRQGVSPLHKCHEIPDGDWMHRHLIVRDKKPFQKITNRMKSLL